MKRITIGLAFVVVGLAALAYVRGGAAQVVAGLAIGGITLAKVSVLLLAAFASAGLLSVMVSEEQVGRWLGKEAGWKGILLGSMAGALIPAGPYVYFPLAATFLMSGAEIGSVISFVTAKNLWTVSRLPLEFALIGPKITFIRYGVTFIFPLVCGLIANMLFSHRTEAVRNSIRRLQNARAKSKEENEDV